MALEITEDIKLKILERFPEADFSKGKFGFSKTETPTLYERVRGFVRSISGERAAYYKTPRVRKMSREIQRGYYADPEKRKKILEKNRRSITKPEAAIKRKKYLQDRYYYGGQREKDLLRLKGDVASKGYGGYFKNPDNALLKDMLRMAEQNPDSGLEIIRKGPRNLIVGVKEGDTIYHAVAAKRKPVAYAPKNSIPITKHPSFKKRFEFTKLQKNFANTKVVGTDLTYGQALDMLESEKAGSALRGKNPAEFEHVKGAAIDYKKGQIALRTANREKQKILAALTNNHITKAEADRQLKKIGTRAFVDGKYIGAPKIDPKKQFSDLKKYVDRKINKVEYLKEVYRNAPKGAPIVEHLEKNIAHCAKGCFIKVANANPERIAKKVAEDPKLIRLFRGESFPQRNIKSLKERGKHWGASLAEMKKDTLSGQWFTPTQAHAKAYLSRPGQMKYVDVTPAELEAFNKYKDRVNKREVKYSTKKKLGLPDAPTHGVAESFHHQIIPRYKLKEMEKAGRLKTKWDLNPLGERYMSDVLVKPAKGVLEYDNILGGFVDSANPSEVVGQNQIKAWAQHNPIPVKVGEAAPGIIRKTGKALAHLGLPLPTAAMDAYFIGREIEEGKSPEEIARNPLNWLGLATMDPLTKAAGMAEKSGKLASVMRLGMSPGLIRGATRFLGLPGLALSTGLTAYDQYQKYKNKEGFIYDLFNREEIDNAQV